MLPPSSPSTPSVTVVTATYNLLQAGRADFFRQCVESVHAQSYGEVEHLIIDGASTDGTRDLIAEYEAKGWLRCLSEPDTGIYNAMNKGLQLARGKYIAFLNSDDLWHSPQAVAASVRVLEETQAAFSYAPYTVINEAGKSLNILEPRLHTFVSGMPIGHPTMFSRTELLRELGGYDEQNYRLIADYDLVTRLLLQGHIGAYVPHNFASFRLGGISVQKDQASRLSQEHALLYRKNYAPLLGLTEEQPLGVHNLPANLLSALSGRVHPNLFTQLCQFVHLPVAPAPLELAPLHTHTSKWKGPLGIPLLTRKTDAGGRRTRWSLMGFLPLLTRLRTCKDGGLYIKSSYKLFSILPAWTCKELPGYSSKHHLLGFLPIASAKHRT